MVTQPAALAHLFRDVVSTKTQRLIHDGVMRKHDLFRFAWKNIPGTRERSHILEEKCDVFLSILEEFEVIMQHDKNADLLLVPSMLPDQRPASFRRFWPDKPVLGQSQFCRRLELGFVMKGFASRLLHKAFHFGITCFS